jgi:hypothetical protein
LNKYNLFHRCSVNTVQDIQYFPNHSNKRLNPQRKFRSADSTGHLNRRRLKVNRGICCCELLDFQLQLQNACLTGSAGHQHRKGQVSEFHLTEGRNISTNLVIPLCKEICGACKFSLQRDVQLM